MTEHVFNPPLTGTNAVEDLAEALNTLDMEEIRRVCEILYIPVDFPLNNLKPSQVYNMMHEIAEIRSNKGEQSISRGELT